MRASAHPGNPRNAASTSATTGASPTATASRSLRCPIRNCTQLLPARHPRDLADIGGDGRHRMRAPGREHGLGRERHAWIDEHRLERQQLQRLGQYIADPAHHPRARIDADRHIGAGLARRRIKHGIVGGR